MHSEAGDVCPCGLHSTGARLHWAEEGPEDVQSNGTTACLWKRGQEALMELERVLGARGMWVTSAAQCWALSLGRIFPCSLCYCGVHPACS